MLDAFGHGIGVAAGTGLGKLFEREIVQAVVTPNDVFTPTVEDKARKIRGLRRDIRTTRERSGSTTTILIAVAIGAILGFGGGRSVSRL